MTPDEFLKLLHRYSRHECSPDEIELIDQWYDRLRAEVEPRLTPEERQALQRHLWQRIEKRIGVVYKPPIENGEASHPPRFNVVRPDVEEAIPDRQLRRWRPNWGWAAAAVAFVVGVGTVINYRYGDKWTAGSSATGGQAGQAIFQTETPTSWTNPTRQPKLITLGDGSTVQLQPGGQLKAPQKAGATTRDVWLTGKAFFSIKHDAKRPFLVYTGSVVTQVLGTTFWVNAPHNTPSVDVSVQTGRVWVSRRTGDETTPVHPTATGQGVMLTPNQQVTFYTDKSQWATGLIEQPRPLKMENNSLATSFNFDETPLTDVLETLQRQYGIEIAATNEALGNCRFTGDISQQPFFTQLELICRSINASYEVVGTRIVVSGAGCEQ